MTERERHREKERERERETHLKLIYLGNILRERERERASERERKREREIIHNISSLPKTLLGRSFGSDIKKSPVYNYSLFPTRLL